MKKILANSEKEINVLETEYKMLLDLLPYNLNLVNIHGIETKKLDKTTYVMYVLMDLAVSDWEKEIMQRKAKKNYYKEEELFIILKELVHTFAELQRHKISHRDIKPQNILLFPDKSFRIADFGEAKEMMTNNRATVKQTIRGTELYMSPILFHALQEKGKIKCAEHNAFKSDVFSLGLCLLFAATLTFNSLCDIRELNNTISMKLALKNYLKRYSMKFTDILFSMLEFDEKYRDDFIELDKIIEYF
jgi:serine/threonine-protein kinase